jgi:spore germination protein KA
MSNHQAVSLTEKLKDLTGNPIDMEIRTVKTSSSTSIQLAFLRSLADPAPVTNFLTQVDKPNLTETSFAQAGEVFIAGNDEEQDSFIVTNLLKGATIVYLASSKPFAVMTSLQHKRPPSQPETEKSVRGPRDGFIENIFDNLSLLRRRLPDPNLRADEMVIGRRTQTKVAVVYLKDIAAPNLIVEVKSRLGKIDVDGVLEPGILEEYIKDNRLTVFPLTLITERPDKIVGAILEGRAAIFVDYCPQVIIVPNTLNDLYQAPDDYYFDFWAGSLIRLVRLMGNVLAIALPGLYVALIGSSPQLLPISLGLTVAGFRVGMPLPLYLEVLVAEIMIELFREAGLRLPYETGQTLGTTIGVMVGFALIQTGYISTPTLIVVGISAIASFTAPNFSVGLTWRITKYLLLLTSGILGFYGFILGVVFIMAHVSSLVSFGAAYTTPWGPVESSGLLDSFIRAPHWLRLKRPQVAKPTQTTRGNQYPKE